MMLIPCPWCGERSENEFTYIGDARRQRPDTSALDVSDETLKAHSDYVYLRDNPKGWHQEYWQHTSGCRAHFKVERNVVDHRIRASVKADEELPSFPEGR